MACLAYKPSDIMYRGMIVDRPTMIQIRRGMIDKITNLLPNCDLFSTSALYPKRYFDDLMIENGLNQKKILKQSGINVSNHHLIVGSPSDANLNVTSSRLLPNIPANNLPFGIGSKKDMDTKKM